MRPKVTLCAGKAPIHGTPALHLCTTSTGFWTVLWSSSSSVRLSKSRWKVVQKWSVQLLWTATETHNLPSSIHVPCDERLPPCASRSTRKGRTDLGLWMAPYQTRSSDRNGRCTSFSTS